MPAAHQPQISSSISSSSYMATETNEINISEHTLMIDGSAQQYHSPQIDPKKSRFPFCIVWTPLPILSWLVPFIGHVGICREDGVILDFAGPSFVSIDNFAFGAVSRYVQLSRDKCSILTQIDKDTVMEEGEEESGRSLLTWDSALRKSTQEYQHRSYNILTCNCHSFVANNLNRLGFQGGGWNIVNVAALVLLKGQWVNTWSMIGSLLPFFVLFIVGITFGGWSFFTLFAAFVFILAGWFLLGTCCFTDLIQI
ncbi:protein RTE1-HOMOLOG-like [Impatiens glandulifera]|uniref:protein RTE1-HOMOLOG-like n=1 Tax=Impatiens glandulifera TaxID=253017 RepID=UPI001FB0E5CA|nr:protein RTE1-HOMOLOG-like [Impatiens glandulifera]